MLLAVMASAVFLAAATKQDDPSIGVPASVALFRSDSKIFATSTSRLKEAVSDMDHSRPESLTSAIIALKESRLAYKRIESFMEYFFVNSARIYNRAPKNEIEEPYLEYQEPIGLQYLESLLYGDDPFAAKKEMMQQARILESSAMDLNSLLYEFKGTDKQILESQRLELIRIIALGIAGFDAPSLKSGITESYAALETMQTALLPYVKKRRQHADSLTFFLNTTLIYLRQNPDFDTFDRLIFLTGYALPLQKHLGKMISAMDLQLNTSGVLNYESDHIFSHDAFTGGKLGRSAAEPEVLLGKKLFFETGLSGNGKISCASCHIPDRFFQDNKAKSLAFDGHSSVNRNAPSLFYAAFQHSQFWDGRARTLEEQVSLVMKDSTEMNGKMPDIVKRLSKKSAYRSQFKKAYPVQTPAISDAHIHRALAAYVRTLHPFNSPFDQYIQGDRKALTAAQINGFNLFMGKAQCGTCHFAPVFNGLIPPLYQMTEFEVLGTTKTDDLSAPQKDGDDGRIHFRPIAFYEGAFKTPTVRNVEKTGPYMHHGAFYSLDSLMEFYNKGGGAGLGLELPYQTLSSNRLNLNENEKKDIILFMQALTDQPLYTKNRGPRH